MLLYFILFSWEVGISNAFKIEIKHWTFEFSGKNQAKKMEVKKSYNLEEKKRVAPLIQTLMPKGCIYPLQT